VLDPVEQSVSISDDNPRRPGPDLSQRRRGCAATTGDPPARPARPAGQRLPLSVGGAAADQQDALTGIRVTRLAFRSEGGAEEHWLGRLLDKADKEEATDAVGRGGGCERSDDHVNLP
jgi:hypothetical protein